MICHKGLFQWKRMPFGLVNAGATFQRLMDTEFAAYSKFIRCYVDDIIVFSKNEKEHLKHLKILFEVLMKMGLKLKSEKRKFFLKDQGTNFMSGIFTDVCRM